MTFLDERSVESGETFHLWRVATRPQLSACEPRSPNLRALGLLL